MKTPKTKRVNTAYLNRAMKRRVNKLNDLDLINLYMLAQVCRTVADVDLDKISWAECKSIVDAAKHRLESGDEADELDECWWMVASGPLTYEPYLKRFQAQNILALAPTG